MRSLGTLTMVGLLGLASCGGGSSAAPTTVGPVQGPVLASDGAALYAAKCASCHGADLRGTALGPSHLSVVYEPGHHSDVSFRAAVLNGVQPHHWNFGPMLPVPGLTDEQIDSIVAFVRTIQAEKGFEPYPPR